MIRWVLFCYWNMQIVNRYPRGNGNLVQAKEKGVNIDDDYLRTNIPAVDKILQHENETCF